MASCIFCDHAKHANRTVCETPNFYAMPTIGQISDGGHMLLIPKQHYPCLGSMEDDKFDEFESVVIALKKAITSSYGKPILFEHGILGQSVPHAHLQLMPSDTDLFTRIHRDFKAYKELSTFRDLQELHRTKGVYLFYQNPSDEMFGFILDSYPQYFRHLAAQAIGKPPRGDWRAWRENPECARLDDKFIDETVKRLRQEIQLPGGQTDLPTAN